MTGSNASDLATFHQKISGHGRWVEPARRSKQHAHRNCRRSISQEYGRSIDIRDQAGNAQVVELFNCADRHPPKRTGLVCLPPLV